MRRTTAYALGGVLAGTVLLGSGTTLATFSDSETVTVVVGAAGGERTAGAVALSVRPVAPAGARSAAPANALALAVDASVTGAPASLQVTAEDAPGADGCGPATRSITVSVSGDRLPALRPVALCDLLDRGRPVVIGAVDAQAGSLTGAVVDVRFDGPDGAPLPAPGWAGTLTFTLAQGSGPQATATVPAVVGDGEQPPTAEEFPAGTPGSGSE